MVGAGLLRKRRPTRPSWGGLADKKYPITRRFLETPDAKLWTGRGHIGAQSARSAAAGDLSPDRAELARHRNSVTGFSLPLCWKSMQRSGGNSRMRVPLRAGSQRWCRRRRWIPSDRSNSCRHGAVHRSEGFDRPVWQSPMQGFKTWFRRTRCRHPRERRSRSRAAVCSRSGATGSWRLFGGRCHVQRRLMTARRNPARTVDFLRYLRRPVAGEMFAQICSELPAGPAHPGEENRDGLGCGTRCGSYCISPVEFSAGNFLGQFLTAEAGLPGNAVSATAASFEQTPFGRPRSDCGDA